MPIAERLSKQRPWLSAEENWLAVERALRQRPWRPWVIRFSGEKERSGWDWADLLLKVSVPVLILALGAGLNKCTSDREERLARQQRDSAVVTTFIAEMQKLVIADRLRPGKEINSEDRVLPREMIIAALAQLSSDEAYQWRNHVLRFARGLTRVKLGEEKIREALLLVEADLSNLNLIGANLSKANLSKANLSRADLRVAHLSEADLSGALLLWANLRRAELGGASLSGAFLSRADLREANLRGVLLSGAYLSGAELSGADLSAANLSGADLGGVRWDEKTQWPPPDRLKDTKNIPLELKKRLGLP